MNVFFCLCTVPSAIDAILEAAAKRIKTVEDCCLVFRSVIEAQLVPPSLGKFIILATNVLVSAFEVTKPFSDFGRFFDVCQNGMFTV